MEIVRKPYIAKPLDINGFVDYADQENDIWCELFIKQTQVLQARACKEYLEGLSLLNLPAERIPQYKEINMVLYAKTGWQLEPVASLIPAIDFFVLLANKKFPVATFIRRREDFHYIQEPDIFHEIIGHCPLLTYPPYADFMEKYGKLSLNAPANIQPFLERLFFFTVETGLVQTSDGLKIYGGGILSSYAESLYALDSPIANRKSFNIIDVIRSDFSLLEMQKTYYIIDSLERLNDLLSLDLTKLGTFG